MSSRKKVMAQNTKGLKGQGHTSRSSVKVTYLFYQTCAWYCWIRTRNLKMMLLLDFAVACVDCTGGNKKKTKKNKKHGNRFNNNIDREYLSVNKYKRQWKNALKGNLIDLEPCCFLSKHPVTYICFQSTTSHHEQKLIYHCVLTVFPAQTNICLYVWLPGVHAQIWRFEPTTSIP